MPLRADATAMGLGEGDTESKTRNFQKSRICFTFFHGVNFDRTQGEFSNSFASVTRSLCSKSPGPIADKA